MLEVAAMKDEKVEVQIVFKVAVCQLQLEKFGREWDEGVDKNV